MAESDWLDIMSVSTENVQIHVYRPQRCVLTASACTDKVGFVNYRLDVASENQQVFSKRKPKNVIHIIDVTLHEQKERWELFYLETVKTVMVDRTLHESSVMSTVTDSLIADQEPKHSVDTDSLQAVSDNSRLLVSSQTSTSTVAPEVVVSNLCTGMVAVETDGGLSSLPVKSHQAYETVDVKQLEQHDNDESCDLPASHDSRATDSGIETSNHGLPLSSEEPDSESRTPVRSSLGKLDVACENQQVFSKQQPKDMTHIVDTTLCEQRERWELFHLEIVRTVMVDRTLHESSVTSSVTDSLIANQEPKHSVETDSLQSVSEYDKTDNSKLLVSSENGPVTDIPTHVSEAVYTDVQTVERDPGLASLSVTTLEDQLADYDQVQEHKNVQSCDLPGNNDNISVVSGIQTSDHGLPVSPEEPLSHKPSSESVVLDHNLPVDIAEESALPADVSKPTHSDVSVIQLAHSEADNMTTIELRTDVTTDYTVTEELEGTHSSTASEMEIHSRLHPENNSLESSEVETKQSQAKGVVDAAVTEHLTTPVDTQDVTFLPAADMGQPDTISCKLMDMDAVITVQTSNDGNTHGIEHIYAHMQPRYDETGVDKADMQCDDETGVVSVDKLPHDDQRVDTQPHDDETGVDRVDKLPHDDQRADTQRGDDETGLDRMDMQSRDDHKVDTQPRDDETGVDRVDKLPHDDQGVDTQRGGDETGPDRMDMQSHDDYRVYTQGDDETGVERVDKVPHDDQRADTQSGDDETGVPNVSVSESGERLIVDTEKPAFLEYGTYATESFTETCSTEEKPADVVEADIMAPDETSELGDRHIQKPVAAIDAVTLKQSVPEEFSEIEHDDGEGEPAAAKTLESLDIKDSSHEPHGRLFSEFQEEIKNEEAALHQCEDEFAASLPTVDCLSVDSSLANSDALSAKCDTHMRSLADLQTKLELESNHELRALIPIHISTIQQQWTQLVTKISERRLELVTQQNVNSQYEDLLHQYATLVNNAEVSVRSIDDKIAADSVEQLMDLLHDNERQMAELQSVGVQLDSAAKKIDAATRARCLPEHQKLTDHACSIQQKASGCQAAVASHIDSWHKFNQQRTDVDGIVDEVDSKLPESIDSTCEVFMLRQQLKDCQDAGDKLQSEMSHISDVMEQGQVLVEYVNSPYVHSQVSDLSGRVHSLTEKINSDIQRLRQILERTDMFESESSALEPWISDVMQTVDRVNRSLETVPPSADELVNVAEVLSELRVNFDVRQPQKVQLLATASELLLSRPDDEKLKERLKRIDDDWALLESSLNSCEQQLTSTQTLLMPSIQAASELNTWMDRVEQTVKSDSGLQPKNADDVEQLHKKFKLLKSDVDDRHRTVDYINECRQLSVSDTPSTALSINLADTTQRYESLSSDVSCQLSQLSLLEPRWQHFDQSVSDVDDWLKTQHDRIPQLQEAARSATISQASLQCQEMQSALSGKRQEVDLLRAEADDLSKTSYWPADIDCLTAQLTRLDDQCTSLDIKLSDVAGAVSDRSLLIDAYNTAVANINKAIEDADSSLHTVSEMPYHDLVSLNSRLALLQNVLQSFRETIKDDELKEHSVNLQSVSDAESAAEFASQTQQLISQWKDEGEMLEKKVTAMEYLSKHWSTYENDCEEAKMLISKLESELDAVIADTNAEHLHMCYQQLQVLKDELTQLNKKLSQLGDVAGQLSAELDPVTSAGVTVSKTTLDDRAHSLELRLLQHCAQLESTMDEQFKFDEIYQVIDTFLKTLPTEESRLGAVNIPLVQRNILAVKEVIVKIEKMQPEMARLNELGTELSLADDDVDKLAELNERWKTTCRDKDKEAEQLEQRIVELEKFSERCEKWTGFVTGVETDVILPVCSYESLLEEQQKIEKFDTDVPSHHETLSSLISDGHALIDSSDGSAAAADFRQKLDLMESRWQNVVQHVGQQRSLVDSRLELWQDYRELLDRLSQILDEVSQSIHQNPVTPCDTEQAKRLLDLYRGLQLKLSDCLTLQDSLNSVSAELTAVSDAATVHQFTTDLDNVSSRHASTSAEVDANIERLQNILKSWNNVRADMESCSLSLTDARQLLTDALPQHQQDLQLQSDKLQKLQSSLSSDDRLPELIDRVKQLSGSTESEESKTLAHSLDVLDMQRAETVQQVAARRQALDKCLSRWTDFDNSYHKLLADLSSLHQSVDATKDLAAEDAIVKIEKELMQQLEDLCKDKDGLNQLADELRGKSTDVQMHDVDHKTADADEKFGQLQDAINNRLRRLKDVVKSTEHLEESIKSLCQWLLDAKERLISPVVYQHADEDEIRRHVSEQEHLEADIDSKSALVRHLLSLCESLTSDENLCCTTTDVTELRRTVDELKCQLHDVGDKAAQRRHFIVETEALWSAFDEDCKSLDTKLTMAERELSNFKVDETTFQQMKVILPRLKALRHKTLAIVVDVRKLADSYRQLASDGRSDVAGTLQHAVRQADERYNALKSAVDDAEQRLSSIVAKKVYFDSNRETTLRWLHGLDKELKTVEALPVSQLKPIQSNIDVNAEWLANMDIAIGYLASKCLESDALDLRRDADNVHLLYADVSSSVQQLMTQSTDDETQRLEVKEADGDDTDSQLGPGRAHIVEKVSRCVIRESVVGWMPGVTDWLTHRARRVGRTGFALLADSEDATDTEQQQSDLDLLERWLTAAEVVLSSLCCKPQQLAKFEEALALHRNLSSDIELWRPLVAEIRSSTTGIAQQTADTEKLCERISLAMKRWVSVCDRSEAVVSNISNWLLTSDNFRISIDNVLAKMDNIRDDIVDVDLGRDVLHQTPDEKQARLDQLSAAVSEIEMMKGRVSRLLNVSQCLESSAYQDIGVEQRDQLTAMLSELDAMRLTCNDRMLLSDPNLPPVHYAYISNEDEDFSMLRVSPNHTVPPRTSTWAAFHKQLGGKATLSDRRCPRSQDLHETEEESMADASLLSQVRRSFVARACCAALPLQLLAFVLLGFAALVPLCEQDCIPPNHFLYSLHPLYRYTEGQPPV